MGSARADRRCPQIAAWVTSLAEKSAQLACEIVDLRDRNLPFGDQPGIPAKSVSWNTRSSQQIDLWKDPCLFTCSPENLLGLDLCLSLKGVERRDE